MSLLAVADLTVALPPGADRPNAVEDLSLRVDPGEIVCVVGESGSGKSVLAAAIARLLVPALRPVSGRIAFDGRDLLTLPESDMCRLRGAGIGSVFQEPMSALNPLMRVGRQIAEGLSAHGRDASPRRIADILDAVGLPEPARLARRHPHALSGGQRQRVALAMALALEPALLVADEPTTALDATTQMRVLRLLAEIRTRHGTGILLVTHDFGVVAEIADRVVVMRHGRMVEAGPTTAVLREPREPYTTALVAAATDAGPPRSVLRTSGPPLLAVRGLVVGHRRPGRLGILFGAGHDRPALADIDLVLRRGETLGLVGESGSGKTTLARCLVGLIRPEGGTIRLDGADLTSRREGDRHRLARRVQLVFQDPATSLNPRRRVGAVVADGLLAQGVPRREAMARAAVLLDLVKLGAGAADRFPHEFSGGQRQRIALARALAPGPGLLVADEPVSALDVSVQAEILGLLNDLRSRLGLTMLFITHDLRVASRICDRIAVMKAGRVVETGETASLVREPRHPYTRALLDSVPGRAWRPLVAS